MNAVRNGEKKVYRLGTKLYQNVQLIVLFGTPEYYPLPLYRLNVCISVCMVEFSL